MLQYYLYYAFNYFLTFDKFLYDLYFETFSNLYYISLFLTFFQNFRDVSIIFYILYINIMLLYCDLMQYSERSLKC